MVALPWRSLSAALPELAPGICAVTGPVGAGKTQFALQIAAHVAAQELEVLLLHPRIDPAEIRARLLGIRSRRPWTDLRPEALPPNITSLSTVGGLSTREATLIVVDHFGGDVLIPARRAALDGAIVVIVEDPTNPSAVRGYVPADVRERAPSEIAEWVGVSAATASEVDTLLVIAPPQPPKAGWSSTEVAVAKHRRGVPARAALRFNGHWFEDEVDEIDLGI